MALGLEVNKAVLDNMAAQAVLQLRSALDMTEAIATWLSNNPVVEGVDPLTQAPYDYSVDEAYVLRLYFESVDNIRDANPDLIGLGRKMTGLQ